MNDRDRTMAILNYRHYDRMPVVHFGFWIDTLQKWVREGHLTDEEARGWSDGNSCDAALTTKLGFDFNYYSTFSPASGLSPGFVPRVVKELPDGGQHVINGHGVVVLRAPDAGSIPAEIEHTLRDRDSWEQHYKWRYEWKEERVLEALVRTGDKTLPFDDGGLEYLRNGQWEQPYGLHCGSLYGHIRDVLGLVGTCYLQADDEELFDEIVDAVGDLCYRNVAYVLEAGARFDFGHFWEDICFKNGPLISPDVFAQKIGPHYKRITDLLYQHGIDVVSLDCDGCIDALVPIWYENGVNTMFPIEVGTWGGSIEPWREAHGRGLRGVGGTNKTLFAHDRKAIDSEIERLKPLVDLGGFVPCPDHRIAPDAKWDLVRYYCDRMREAFG